jgi:hypothetical protein
MITEIEKEVQSVCSESLTFAYFRITVDARQRFDRRKIFHFTLKLKINWILNLKSAKIYLF